MLRVVNSKTKNRTRLRGFFIVDGNCLRRLVRIVWSSVRLLNVIKIFLRKTYYIDKISSPFTEDVCSLGRHIHIYIPHLSVHGLHLFTIVSKYLPPISAGQCEVGTLLTLRMFFPLTGNGT